MPTGVYERQIRDPKLRFAEKSRKDESGCILWTGPFNRDGYGVFTIRNVFYLAHRWGYTKERGLIPKDLVIDHLCRTPACVNIDHLEVVTHGENSRRGTVYQVSSARFKAQTHCKRGHPLFGDNCGHNKKDGGRFCKTCMQMKVNEWRVKNRDKLNERQRERRKQHKELNEIKRNNLTKETL